MIGFGKALHNCIFASKSINRSLSQAGVSLTHVKDGMPTMVDVSEKAVTRRQAHARAEIVLPPNVLEQLLGDSESQTEVYSKKGPVFATAIVAGVMAAKKTHELIPFCHPIFIDGCDINIQFNQEKHLIIDCIAKTSGKTGVEMEALVGATNAAMCVYDMLKALSHDIVVKDIRLIKKTGGKSDYSNKNNNNNHINMADANWSV